MSKNNFTGKKRKLSASALRVILNAHLVLAIISFVTLVVLIALHLISSHNRGVFVLLVAISVASIAAYFIGRKTWYKRAIWRAIAKQEAKDKAEAEKNDQVYCTKEHKLYITVDFRGSVQFAAKNCKRMMTLNIPSA